MGLVGRAGINHRDLSLSNDIAVCPPMGHRRGVGCQDPSKTGFKEFDALWARVVHIRFLRGRS